MEIRELKQEEKISIYGGNPASEGFWFAIGLICKCIVEFAAGGSQGGYTYAKCGTSQL